MVFRHKVQDAFERSYFQGIVIGTAEVMLAVKLSSEPNMRTVLADSFIAKNAQRFDQI
jgi:hypothetical protein